MPQIYWKPENKQTMRNLNYTIAGLKCADRAIYQTNYLIQTM